MIKPTLIRKTFNLRCLEVQKFSQLPYGRKHGGTQAYIVLERYLKVLHLNWKAVGSPSVTTGLP